jgi:hypothetical protein
MVSLDLSIFCMTRYALYELMTKLLFKLGRFRWNISIRESSQRLYPVLRLPFVSLNVNSNNRELAMVEDDHLTTTINDLRGKVVDIKTLLKAHKDCPVGEASGRSRTFFTSRLEDAQTNALYHASTKRGI